MDNKTVERIDLPGGWYLEPNWIETNWSEGIPDRYIGFYRICSPCSTVSSGAFSPKLAEQFAQAMNTYQNPINQLQSAEKKGE